MVARLLAALARAFTRRTRHAATITSERTAQPDVPTDHGHDNPAPQPDPITGPATPVDLDDVYQLVAAVNRGELTWSQAQAQLHGTDNNNANEHTTEPTAERTQTVGEAPAHPGAETLGIAPFLPPMPGGFGHERR